MVDVNALRNAIRKHQWGVSLDFKDAYLHVMVHKNSRKYLRFVINGVIYQYRTMPFGLNVSPRIFTILVGTIVKWAAGNGIQMITYLDDSLILHHNVDTLLTHAAQVIQKTLDLGWIINTKKSDLVPKNVFEFIGLEINTTLFSVRPTEKRLTDLQIQISLFWNARVIVADIMRMQGILISLGEIVPLGKLNRRKFHQSISHIKTHKLKKSKKSQ